MNPKVSVIMAGYNAERYVEEALASVVSQSLKDIEIIFVDDGSTDATLEIVRKFAASDQRISILARPHEGAGAARNAGLDAACGEYLSILDADDLFDRQMLEKSYALASKEQADIVVFKYRAKDIVSGKIRHRIGFSLPSSYVGKNAPAGVAGLTWSNPTAWNKLFRRGFLKQYGLRFQNLPTCNDFAFTKSAVVAATSIFFLDEELLTYRQNPHNTTSTRYQHAECIIKAGNAVLNFIHMHTPESDLRVFYDMMYRHCRYEYNQFPRGADTRAFVAAFNGFMPLKYRWRFFWKRVSRAKKHFRARLRETFA